MKFGGLNLTDGLLNTGEAVIADNCDLSHEVLQGVNAHKDITGTVAWGANRIRGIFRGNSGLLVAAAGGVYDDGVLVGAGNEFNSGADVSFAKVVNDVFMAAAGNKMQTYDGTSFRDAGPVDAPSLAPTLAQVVPIFSDRTLHTTTAIGTTKMVLVGGKWKGDIWESNSLGTSWTKKGDMDKSAYGNIYAHASAANGTDLFISGGMRSQVTTGNGASANVYKWDGTTLTTLTTSAAFGTRAYHSMWVHNGYLYVAGGYDIQSLLYRTVYKSAVTDGANWTVVYTGTGGKGTFLDGYANPGRGVLEFNSKPTAIVDQDRQILLNAPAVTVPVYTQPNFSLEAFSYWLSGQSEIEGKQYDIEAKTGIKPSGTFRVEGGYFGAALLVYNKGRGFRFLAPTTGAQTYTSDAAARSASDALIGYDDEVRVAVFVTKAEVYGYSFGSYWTAGSDIYAMELNYTIVVSTTAYTEYSASKLTPRVFTSSDSGASWDVVTHDLSSKYGPTRGAVTSGGKLYFFFSGGLHNTTSSNDLSQWEKSPMPEPTSGVEAWIKNSDFTIFGSPEMFYVTSHGLASTGGSAAWGQVIIGFSGELSYYYSFYNTTSKLESALSPGAPVDSSLTVNNEAVELSTFSALPTGTYAYRLYRFGTDMAIGATPQFVAEIAASALPYIDIIANNKLGDIYDDKGGGDNLPPVTLSDISYHNESSVLFGIDVDGDLVYSKPYPDHENWPVENKIILESKAVKLAQYQGYLFAFSKAGITVVAGFYQSYSAKIIPGAPGIVAPTSTRLPQSIAIAPNGIFYLSDDGIYVVTTNSAVPVRNTELASLALGGNLQTTSGFYNNKFVMTYSSEAKAIMIDEDGVTAQSPTGTAVIFYLDGQTLIYGTDAGKIYEWQGASSISLFDYQVVPSDGKTTAPKEWRKIVVDGEGRYDIIPIVDGVSKTTITIAPSNTNRIRIERSIEYRGKRVQFRFTATNATYRAKVYSFSVDAVTLICGDG